MPLLLVHDEGWWRSVYFNVHALPARSPAQIPGVARRPRPAVTASAAAPLPRLPPRHALRRAPCLPSSPFPPGTRRHPLSAAPILSPPPPPPPTPGAGPLPGSRVVGQKPQRRGAGARPFPALLRPPAAAAARASAMARPFRPQEAVFQPLHERYAPLALDVIKRLRGFYVKLGQARAGEMAPVGPPPPQPPSSGLRAAEQGPACPSRLAPRAATLWPRNT